MRLILFLGRRYILPSFFLCLKVNKVYLKHTKKYQNIPIYKKMSIFVKNYKYGYSERKIINGKGNSRLFEFNDANGPQVD